MRASERIHVRRAFLHSALFLRFLLLVLRSVARSSRELIPRAMKKLVKRRLGPRGGLGMIFPLFRPRRIEGERAALVFSPPLVFSACPAHHRPARPRPHGLRRDVREIVEQGVGRRDSERILVACTTAETLVGGGGERRQQAEESLSCFFFFFPFLFFFLSLIITSPSSSLLSSLNSLDSRPHSNPPPLPAPF